MAGVSALRSCNSLSVDDRRGHHPLRPSRRFTLITKEIIVHTTDFPVTNISALSGLGHPMLTKTIEGKC